MIAWLYLFFLETGFIERAAGLITASALLFYLVLHAERVSLLIETAHLIL